MIEASGKEREQLMQKVKADLKGRIDETSKYIRPSEHTMDFAFMFIRSRSEERRVGKECRSRWSPYH